MLLKKKLNKYQTKQLGQLVKTAYLSKYNSLPEKTVINLKSQKGEDIIRIVAVYPTEFNAEIDKLILSYSDKQEAVLKYKKDSETILKKRYESK